MYDRSDNRTLRIVDEWADGFGWQVAPHETSQRTSHAIETADGLWLLDPLDAPGLDELLQRHGEVAGVAVCADYHSRDASTIASRHEVPVLIPTWCKRAARQLNDAPFQQTETTLGESELRLRNVAPLGWNEAAVWHPPSATLYIPDVLGTAAGSCAGQERVGLMLLERLRPPADALLDLEPEYIRCGHGQGIEQDATTAVRDAITNGRRRFPRALIECGPTQLRAIVGAIRR